MKNLNNTIADADPSQHSLQNHSKLIDPNEELEIDWTDLIPILFDITSSDPNSSPVIPSEMTQFVPPLPPPRSPRPRNQTMNIENGFNPTSFNTTPCPNPDPTLERQVDQMPRFDPTQNMMFEMPRIAKSSSLPRNQTINGEDIGFNPNSFGIPCPDPIPTPGRHVEMSQYDSIENMMFAMPSITTSPLLSSPSRNQMINGENIGFNPNSFGIPCPDPISTPGRHVEMSQYDSIENMMFAMPSITMSPLLSSPPRNQMINGENNGFNPTSFVIPCPDPNPTPGRQVEMSRFDQTENMMIENPWNEMQQPPPSSSSLPFNQTMNLENNLNPNPFFNPVFDPNLTLVSPVEMHAFNPIENRVFEDKWTAMSSSPFPPCNQTTNTKNLDFSPFRYVYKTKADIICENHLGAYSSSIRTAAAFNNILSSDSEMQYFPAAAAVSSSSTRFSPPCNEDEAATHGRADSSTFKRKWSVQEHKLLLVGMEIFGKGDWTNIADKVVITKSNTQVSSHAQKYFVRLTLPIEKKEKRSSIHDITEFEPELLSMVRARLGLPSSSLLLPPSNE